MRGGRFFNAALPTLHECGYGTVELSCRFCCSTDLRVGGRQRFCFLSCPRCGADGPVGESLEHAIRLYGQDPRAAARIIRARP